MRIAIVGGGPAGAMAAIRLARAGADVTIFDASHPREKPCGGGLTGRALALIADCVDVSMLPAVVVRTALVEQPSSAGLEREALPARVNLVDRGISPDSSLVVSSRAIFDKRLLDAAVKCGARLVAEKVAHVTRNDRVMNVRTAHREQRADMLLGADGAGSLVRKTLGRPFRRSELSIAAGYFVHGACSSDISIRSMTAQPGYLWSFPRPDHLAVGVCGPASASTAPDLRLQCRHWIESRGSGDRTALEPYAWPIPSVGFSSAHEICAAGDGWMLLGDAAGLVDPLTREGIFYALLSGIWAAEAIIASGASGASDRESAEAVYANRIRREMHPELNRAARLSGLFFSPRFSALFVAALRESGSIRGIFADLVAGTQPYLGLKRRLLATREWKLAGRALRLVVQ